MQTSASISSMQASDLLALPAKLCLQICTYVLSQDDTIDMYASHNAPTPALLQVYRQIREECRSDGLYYKFKSSWLTAEDYQTAGALAFCQAAGSNSASVKSLTLEIRLSDSLMHKLHERYELPRGELALMPRKSYDKPRRLLYASRQSWTSLLLALEESGRAW